MRRCIAWFWMLCMSSNFGSVSNYSSILKKWPQPRTFADMGYNIFPENVLRSLEAIELFNKGIVR